MLLENVDSNIRGSGIASGGPDTLANAATAGV